MHTTKDCIDEAARLACSNPSLSKFDVVKALTKNWKISFTVANRAVKFVAIKYPKFFIR
jgi:hypothetical protein